MRKTGKTALILLCLACFLWPDTAARKFFRNAGNLAPLLKARTTSCDNGVLWVTAQNPAEEYDIVPSNTPHRLVVLPEAGKKGIKAKVTGPGIRFLHVSEFRASTRLMNLVFKYHGVCFSVNFDGTPGYGAVVAACREDCARESPGSTVRGRVSSTDPQRGVFPAQSQQLSDGKGIPVGQTAYLLFEPPTAEDEVGALADVAFDGLLDFEGEYAERNPELVPDPDGKSKDEEMARVYWRGQVIQGEDEIYLSVGALASLCDASGDWVILTGKFLSNKDKKKYEFKPTGGGTALLPNPPELIAEIDALAKKIFGKDSGARERTPGARELRLFIRIPDKTAPGQRERFRHFVRELFVRLNEVPRFFQTNVVREIEEELMEETGNPAFASLRVCPPGADSAEELISGAA